ncbi:hypothetical protein FA95DRAFT_867008 [Auriscalpium vulgare]|uniref:Uncharacterized protein n=1 Tax=Auriscalpium vulgare TaxID=40419 RepID=A0ACB8R9A4_9AGAM|nr:hypothetical protein FA95DRAFT_867008 [Auriscalpium vulgare]
MQTDFPDRGRADMRCGSTAERSELLLGMRSWAGSGGTRTARHWRTCASMAGQGYQKTGTSAIDRYAVDAAGRTIERIGLPRFLPARGVILLRTLPAGPRCRSGASVACRARHWPAGVVRSARDQ